MAVTSPQEKGETEMRSLTVFEFTIWYDGDDVLEDKQYRYVVAHSEEEAEFKLQEENQRCMAEGSMHFNIGRCVVEIDDVII